MIFVAAASSTGTMSENIGYVQKIQANDNEHISFTNCMIYWKAPTAKQ